jgi:3-oxo-5-alpha-steroid 4-dehydrogenase 1
MVLETTTTTDIMAYGMIIAAIITLPILIYGPTAPYGRYSTTGWGFMISTKLAWVTQELWSLGVPVIWLTFFATEEQWSRLLDSVGDQSTTTTRSIPYSIHANGALMVMFLLHYIYRDVIYPFRLRGGKPTPFFVWLLAFIFCLYNGYMQTRYLLYDAPTNSITTPWFVVGSIMWCTGWVINIQSDSILISLRSSDTRKKSTYKIPRGGLFTYVSAANYFGEMVEWIGYAVASGGALPAVAFALFTCCNLGPRGYSHHQWYLKHFPSYSRLNRKSVIPFVV